MTRQNLSRSAVEAALAGPGEDVLAQLIYENDPGMIRQWIDCAREGHARLDAFVAKAEETLGYFEHKVVIPFVCVHMIDDDDHDDRPPTRFALSVRMAWLDTASGTPSWSEHHADRLSACTVRGVEAAVANAVRIAREVDGLVEWDPRGLGDTDQALVRRLLPPDLDRFTHENEAEQAWIKRHRAATESSS